MRLISLEMHNFRKFKDAEIKFPEGIIGLVGNNGAGKSTIIEAIGWALYGNRAARTSRDEIKRQGAARSDDCWVKLVFELGGNTYEVFRIISGKSTDARVKVNGLITASSTQAVTQFLEKKLGMDYDSFYTSIVAKQQELNALSDKSPAERKKSMLKMLKIDLLEEAIKRVREDRRNKEKILEYMKKSLKDIEELERERENKKKDLEEYQFRKDEKEKRVAELEKKLREMEERRRREKEKAVKFNELEKRRKLLEERKNMKETLLMQKTEEKQRLMEKSSEYEKLRSAVIQYDKVSKKKEEMESDRKRYYERENLMREISILQKEMEKIEKEIVELNKKLAEEEKYRKDFESIKAEIEKIDGEIGEIENKLREEMAEKKAIISKMEEISKKIENIRRLGPESNCPTCGRPLKEKYEEIIKNFNIEFEEQTKRKQIIEENMQKLKEKREELRNKKEKFVQEMEKLEKILLEYRVIKGRIENFMRERKEKEGRMEEVKIKIQEMGEIKFNEDEYERVTEEFRRLRSLYEKAIVIENEIRRIPKVEEEIKAIKEEIEFIVKEIGECLKEIELLDFDMKRYEEIEKEYEGIRREFHATREELIKLKGEIEFMQKDIERISEEIEEQKKQREEIKKLKKEIANLELLAGDRDTGLLNQFKNYLISKIGPLLSHYASHFFSTFTNGKYKDIEIDENYNIWIYDRGEKFELDRFSGGEKDLANLSLRLAISQLIAQRADVALNFIALDEIFGSQDRERRKNVLNALAELKKQFKQILLITHIEEIKDSMEHILKVYEDEEGISHVKIE